MDISGKAAAASRRNYQDANISEGYLQKERGSSSFECSKTIDVLYLFYYIQSDKAWPIFSYLSYIRSV